MRVIITGGAGFVGSHLCERWLDDGHQVVAVDNYCTGRASNVEHLLSNPGFELVDHDVTVPLEDQGQVDFIFHMACPASPVDYLALPIETMMVCSAGTKNMLDLARAQGAGFLLASTSECYGDPLEHPQKESYWGHVNPIGPRSVYDEAKRFSEALTMSYFRKFGVETHIVRIFNTYGPRMKLNDGRVVPNFIDQALRGQPISVYGDGSQTRSFCYVSDLVEGLTRLALSDEREPVNIGNPTELTILEFAETIQRLIGSDCPVARKPLPADDPRQRKPDISKAQRLLNWEPKVGLEEGLRRTVEYFRGETADVTQESLAAS